MPAQTILVVDDEADLRDLLREHLSALGYRVVTADSAEQALIAAEAAPPDLVLTDVNITTLGATIEARDPYTGGHCERLSRYAVALGQALGVDEPTLRALRLGGFLHDLGKIAAPDAILLKAGRLDAAERTRIETHSVVGADLVRGVRTLDGVRPIIRHHHERWDGSGYPDGLRGDSIPLGARIMAVVDVYDALRTARPYKPPLPEEDTLNILRRETEAGAWDPRVTSTLLDALRNGLIREP